MSLCERGGSGWRGTVVWGIAAAWLAGGCAGQEVVRPAPIADDGRCREPESWVALQESSSTLAAQITKAATLNVSHSDRFALHQFSGADDFSKQMAEYYLCLEQKKAEKLGKTLNPAWEDWYREYWSKAVGEQGFDASHHPEKYLTETHEPAESCDGLGSTDTLKQMDTLIRKVDSLVAAERDTVHYVIGDEELYLITRRGTLYEVSRLTGGSVSGSAGRLLTFYSGSIEAMGLLRAYDAATGAALPLERGSTVTPDIRSAGLRVGERFDLVTVSSDACDTTTPVWVMVNPTRFSRHDGDLRVRVLLDWDVPDGAAALYQIAIERDTLVCRTSDARPARLDQAAAQALQQKALAVLQDPLRAEMSSVLVRSALEFDVNPRQMFGLIIPVPPVEATRPPETPGVFVHTSQ